MPCASAFLKSRWQCRCCVTMLFFQLNLVLRTSLFQNLFQNPQEKKPSQKENKNTQNKKNIHLFSHQTSPPQKKKNLSAKLSFVFWLVVEPTHLTNMLVKLDHETPRFGVKIPKMFELPSPSKTL